LKCCTIIFCSTHKYSLNSLIVADESKSTARLATLI